MDPVYNCMHSYPHQRDQMHYWPHNYPGTQPFPTQIFVNPARPPVNYESWPWGNNYVYASPVACHGCGNYNYLPNHCGWRSPYYHVPPVHCPGSLPFPVQYMPPPPYAMQQPQYVYDENIPRNHHSCGCPNHQCHQKEQKNIKIEEEEPDIERRKNDSLVPFQFKNYPYPIVRLPHDFGNNKEHEKLNKSEHKEEKNGFLDAKPNENRKNAVQQQNVWNKWYPFELQNLESLDQRGDGARNHQQQDDGKGRFPFPIFWMPYDPEEKETKAHKVNDANQEQSLVSVEGSDAEQKFNVHGEHTGGHASSKSKDIPVKEVEQREEKERSSIKEKERDASVKDGNDNEEKKFSKDGSKSSSPTKSFKLPPVCLRVDPLPRRKTSNGNSRSPSPPGDKRKLDQLSSNKARKVLTPDNEKSSEITKNKITEGKGITKIIEVADGKTCQGESKDVKVYTPVNLPASSLEEVSTNQTEDKPKEENISQPCCEPGETVTKGQSEYAGFVRGENGELSRNEEVTKDEAKKSSKRKLTNEEAAVIIQSAYRGFDVRRWEPVTKLKQIAKVREQIGDVKNRIQELEASSDIQYSSKQMNIIAETIMSLLLKLDTIQGSHPYVREVRKSVVRELVSHQEKLDSLINEKSEAAPTPESSMRHDEDIKEPVDITPSKNADETQSDLLEPCRHRLDGESRNENLEVSDKSLNGEQMGEKLETESAELLESCVDNSTESASEPTITKEEEQGEKVLEDEEVSIANKMEDSEDKDVGQSSELSFLRNNSSLEVMDFSPEESSELPQGVPDDSYTSECASAKQFEEDTSKADQAEQPEEVMIEASISPEMKIDLTDEVNEEHVKLDLPLEETKVELEDKETTTEEKLDNKIGDASFDPDECSAQIPQNVIADIFEPYEASDERERPIEETNATCSILHDGSGVMGFNNSSTSEEALKNSMEKEINSSQLAPECQEKGPINDSANVYESGGMVGVEKAEEESEDDIVAQHKQTDGADIDDCDAYLGEGAPEKKEACHLENEGVTDISPDTEVSVDPSREYNLDHLLPKDSLEAERVDSSAGNEENAEVARDALIVTNGKLVEENERLRDMLEKLIKSGQEQLTAISSLTGRVKDLERRLSRKRKLKMNLYRGSRSCIAASNDSLKESSTDVAIM